MKIDLAKTEIIHFIGIGGIGMSGLSLIMKGKGLKVQGSDIFFNKNIERLKNEKIKVFIGHKKQNLQKATIVVISFNWSRSVAIKFSVYRLLYCMINLINSRRLF